MKIIEDFPPEIDQCRCILRPYLIVVVNFKPANGQIVSAKLNIDCMTINNKTYTVETVGEISKEFHSAATKKINTNMVAFHSMESLFSNFYPNQMSDEG